MAIKHYSTDDVTIKWQSDLCIHSAICAKGLPHVFDPKARPWIKPENATIAEVIAQVNKCPSGAISIVNNDQEVYPNEPVTRVDTIPNGPLMVHGELTINHAGKTSNMKKVTAFCRCGASQNKPFCDGAHKEASFEG